MSTMDLSDIQGNVLRGYRMPLARYCFLRVDEAEGGRRFVQAIEPEVTSAEAWAGKEAGKEAGNEKPKSALNVSFTHAGLAALRVAVTPESFPAAFRQGMRARAAILGDDFASAPERWDPVWSAGVHLLVAINAINAAARDRRFEWLRDLTGGGVTLLPSHQDAGILVHADGSPTGTEHFGYVDGIGQPDFRGAAVHAPGGGKLARDGGWEPLQTGEFLLGYEDEAGETPELVRPPALARNGTFLVYRKLHQNVASFRSYLHSEGERYPGGRELLAAKFVGRWRNGTPLELSPAAPWPDDWLQDPARRAAANDFRYASDEQGLRCPVGAHIRRSNPRDSLGFDGLRSNRRRILRRGLTYGETTPAAEFGDDASEHGIIFMALGVDIERQFEFVQQEWMNYGNHFHLGNDKDALIGSHDGRGKALIEGNPPYLCTGLPRFVETRGGDYFFLPGKAALRLIAEARVGVG